MGIIAHCNYILAQGSWQSMNNGVDTYDATYTYIDEQNNRLYFFGGLHSINGIATNGIAVFDGQNWNSMNSDSLAYHSISWVTNFNNTLYITSGIKNTEERFIFKWENNKWVRVCEIDGLVYGSKVYDNKLYIFGDFTQVDNVIANGLAVFDGTNWSDFNNLPNLYGGSSVNRIVSIEFFNNELYVGGNFTGLSNAGHDIVKWNGNSWTGVDGAFFGGLSSVSGLEVFKNQLYVTGTFSKKEDARNPGNYIARWDGTNWSEVGKGTGTFPSTNGQINRMYIFNDTIYVIGTFEDADGIPAHRLAIFDGEKWCRNETNYGNTLIFSVNKYQGKILITGGFRHINGDSSIARLAIWEGGGFIDYCAQPIGIEEIEKSKFSVFPNPAFDFITIENKINQNKNYTYSIFDYQGKKIKDRNLNFSNSTENISIQEFNSGIYFIRIESEKGVSLEKFVKL